MWNYLSSVWNLFSSGTSSWLYGVILSLFASLCFVGWLYKESLQEVANLEVALQVEAQNTQELKSAIEKQNNALKEVQVIATYKDTSAVEKIYIKDSSCEAQLQGYKRLFKELGK